jgi:hypothetical protein
LKWEIKVIRNQVKKVKKVKIKMYKIYKWEVDRIKYMVEKNKVILD